MRRRIVRFVYQIFLRREFPDIHTLLRRAVGPCKTLLDVGCGASSPIKIFSKGLFCVGVDAFRPSIEKSRNERIHDEYYVMDALDIDKKFDDNSFDCVLASDLIEHLTKKDGFKLLSMMERIAKNKIIIFTTNGYLPQVEYDSNPWQAHRSGWIVSEMKKKGFEVIGVNGWRLIGRKLVSMGRRARRFWTEVADATEIVVEDHPERAFQLLCVKTKRSNS